MLTDKGAKAEAHQRGRGLAKKDGMDGSVIGEEEDGLDGADFAEEGKRGEHKIEESKARLKGEDGVARAHPSDRSGSAMMVVAKNRARAS